jgi:hypothetical protein
MIRTGGHLLQPVEALVYQPEILAHRAELGHELHILKRMRPVLARRRDTCDEVPALLLRDNQSFGTQHIDPVADRHRRDVVLAGKVSLDRKAVPHLVPASDDGSAQVVSDLLVRGTHVIAAGCHRSRLPRPAAASPLGDPPCARSPSLLYFAI